MRVSLKLCLSVAETVLEFREDNGVKTSTNKEKSQTREIFSQWFGFFVAISH